MIYIKKNKKKAVFLLRSLISHGIPLFFDKKLKLFISKKLFKNPQKEVTRGQIRGIRAFMEKSRKGGEKGNQINSFSLSFFVERTHSLFILFRKGFRGIVGFRLPRGEEEKKSSSGAGFSLFRIQFSSAISDHRGKPQARLLQSRGGSRFFLFPGCILLFCIRRKEPPLSPLLHPSPSSPRWWGNGRRKKRRRDGKEG